MAANTGGIDASALHLGMRANMGQFLVQTLLVFFVGMTIGLERTVVPLLARDEFGIASASVILSFVVSFGFVKAALNVVGGHWSERWGRKPLLIVGWVVALPIPLIIIYAPSWWWIIGANVLMGINQGLAWSMTVTAKVDIVGSRWRGLAIGINEFAGYTGVALTGLITGVLASSYGLRPAPFLFGMVVTVVALLVSIFMVKETRGMALAEARNTAPAGGDSHRPSFWQVFQVTSWRDRSLFAYSQAGLVEKFVDALVWVSFPLYFSTAGLSPALIGLIVGVYGFTWGGGQLITGPLSDHIGRKPPIVAGMFLCGLGVALTAHTHGVAPWTISAAVTGLGMALVYPTLLAGVADASRPEWRGASLGVYRMWRDGGYGVGALMIGAMTDWAGVTAGFEFVAAMMAASGLVVAVVARETAPSRTAANGLVAGG